MAVRRDCICRFWTNTISRSSLCRPWCNWSDGSFSARSDDKSAALVACTRDQTAGARDSLPSLLAVHYYRTAAKGCFVHCKRKFVFQTAEIVCIKLIILTWILHRTRSARARRTAAPAKRRSSPALRAHTFRRCTSLVLSIVLWLPGNSPRYSAALLFDSLIYIRPTGMEWNRNSVCRISRKRKRRVPSTRSQSIHGRPDKNLSMRNQAKRSPIRESKSISIAIGAGRRSFRSMPTQSCRCSSGRGFDWMTRRTVWHRIASVRYSM